MPSSKASMKPVAAVAVSLFALASAGKAAVVCYNGAAIPVPTTTAGVYVNLVTFVNAPTPGGSPGWDINPWGSGSFNLYFNNGANPSPGGAVAVPPAPAVLNSGATISAAQTYTTTTPGTTTADWRTTNTGKYLGVRFWNESAGAIQYAWMQIDTVNIDVGMPEAFLDVRPGVDARDFAPAIRVEPHRGRRKMCSAFHRLADA